MKRVLIVGVSSFIGSNLAVYLRKYYRVFGTYSTRPPRIDDVPSFRFTIEPQTPIRGFVRALRPDAIVYCVAEKREELFEKDPKRALFLNAEAGATFASAVREYGGTFIFLSTPKVFSGDEGGYREEDPTHPLTLFASSKRTGEEFMSNRENAFVLRLGTVFGISSSSQVPGLLQRIITSLWSQKVTPLICDEYRSLVSTDELTRAVGCAIDAGGGKAGLYHVAGAEKYTLYTFAKRVARIFGLSSEHLRAVRAGEYSALHPRKRHSAKDLSLSGQLFSESFSFRYDPIDLSLERMRDRFRLGTQ